MNSLWFDVTLVFVVLTNVLWYWVKFLVSSRGYPMSYFRHFQDLHHLNRLIDSESDAVARSHHIRLRMALYTSLAITLCLFAMGIAGAIYANYARTYRQLNSSEVQP
ncbi:MAG: hypothetical protein P4L99_17725 [Chthoniobacter sp.]|nr:hypothetical protein [Chthoniobacter sp.]